ncbi:MAG: ArsA family ATPase [Merismopedia sp. SIO2A8]|nr:ArsA family ATPase [Merismopedia sp. SIO2A8]
MTFMLTFLGKGGVGRSTVAIATAQQLASQGKRVLLASQDTGPAIGLMLGIVPTCDPQSVMPNFEFLQFQSTVLLERSWDEVKRLESQYLKDPFFKAVYGQELGILPGMDEALALNALREYEASGTYDVIIYDGRGDQSTLRMFGMPDIFGWYLRRFRSVFLESNFVKTLTPFVQPVTSAVLNVDWGSDWLSNPNQEADNILAKGKAAVTDPNRVAAYLVTTDATDAIATAQYLWGSAQQIGLTVNGVLLNQANTIAEEQSFSPLPISPLPFCTLLPLASPDNWQDRWQPLIQALPDLFQNSAVPRSITIDVNQRTVTLFLPHFDKKQVKLTQYGPEVTVEAGDQRRNIFLPPELCGKPVTGAKFQDSHLVISF